MNLALLFGGERGLKPLFSRFLLRWRTVALLFGGERGLKLDANRLMSKIRGRSPFRRGAWIETTKNRNKRSGKWVALLFGGERGLKHLSTSAPTKAHQSLSFSEGSVD